MNYKGKVTINAKPLDVWDFLLDVDKFSACFPGVQELTRVDDKTFEGKMTAKVGPMSGNFEFQATITDAEPPVKLTAQVAGTDSLTKSTMTADISMALSELGPEETELEYQSTVNVEGRLAIIGDMILRATGAQVIKEFFKRLRNNIEKQEA